MRSLITLVFIVFTVVTLQATDYFSQGSLNVNLTSSWRSAGGSYPPNFTTAGNRFIVQNGHSMTASAQWTVSGTNSYVVIQNGGKITTGAFNHQITGTVQNGGTYEVTHTTYSNLGWGGYGVLEPSSNFILNNSGINFNDGVLYGNLIVQNGTADVLGSTGLTIQGILTVKTNGVFEGGATNDHTNTLGGIRVEGNGVFYGSTGASDVTYQISGNVEVAGGYFLGSEGTGTCVYNIGGDVLISGGFFYATYKESNTLPNNTFNIGGSFTRTGGYYYAVNRIDGGYPSIYLTGAGKNLGLGDLSESYMAWHEIYVQSGASYTLTNTLPLGQYRQFILYGTLTVSTYQIKPITSDCTIQLAGYLKTANTYGMSGHISATIPSTFSPGINLSANSTVEFNAPTTQTFTPRSDYRTVILSGGSKTLATNATVATQLTVNAVLDIQASAILTLTGALSATQLLQGLGTLNIAGSSLVAQLQLPACTLGAITLNRLNGCAMIGSVSVTNLTLTNGTFAIGDQALTLNGNLNLGIGTLTGGTQADLTVAGSVAALAIPITLTRLDNFTITRPNGCTMQNGLGVTTLNLDSGPLNVGSFTLTFYGALNIDDGTLNVLPSSTLSVQSGSVDINLPTLSLGSLIVNRSGGYCILDGSLLTRDLQISSGTLSLQGYTVSVSATMSFSGGAISGDANSALTLGSAVFSASLPSMNVHHYTQLCDITVQANGGLNIHEPSLTAGNLYLSNNYLSVTGGFPAGVIIPNLGVISGTTQSALYLAADNALPWELPQFNIGTLSCNLTGGCIINHDSYIGAYLNLNQGAVNPNGHLTLLPFSTIVRTAGFLSSAPVLNIGLSVHYLQPCSTGYELPSGAGILSQIYAMGPQTVVLSQQDIYLSQRIAVMMGSTFDLNGHMLFCEPGVMFEGNGNLFGTVQIDIGVTGLNAQIAGLQIAPGALIENFSFAQLPIVQQLNAAVSIQRTWILNGTYEFPIPITFYWYPEADNGLEFSPINTAKVFRQDGTFWQQIGDPMDVSMMIPRAITVLADHFSIWTVGTGAPLGVPFVMDFEEGWQYWKVANGSGTNHWCIGTEVAYRNTHAAYISNDGSTYAYDTNVPSIVHTWVDVLFPQDMTDVRLRFEWIGAGEPDMDYLSVTLSECSFTPLAGVNAHGLLLGTYLGNPEGSLETIELASSLAGQVKRLIFSWQNDFQNGDQPPCAIDNVRIVDGNAVLEPPQNVSIHQEDEEIVVNWDIVPTANDYSIEICDTIDGEYLPIDTRGNPHFYYLADPLKLFIRIRATD